MANDSSMYETVRETRRKALNLPTRNVSRIEVEPAPFAEHVPKDYKSPDVEDRRHEHDVTKSLAGVFPPS